MNRLTHKGKQELEFILQKTIYQYVIDNLDVFRRISGF